MLRTMLYAQVMVHEAPEFCGDFGRDINTRAFACFYAYTKK